jgi:diguanylate cyclase (GGDEF)-like protein
LLTGETGVRTHVADEVRAALDNSRLEIWYQPKVDVVSGRVVGVEALLRQRAASGEIQSPAQILQAAEQAGMMAEITAHVLATAVADCASWRAESCVVPVAVNITPDDLSSPELPSAIGALLDCHGLPGDMLSLEITETAMLNDPARSAEVMQALRRLGVTLSADDFGVGYSCLSRLVQLPLTELKIDLGLVLSMHTSRHGHATVRAVIDLGHALGLRVVAEGVEDERTLRELREARCDLAQGYLFSRAVPAPELLAWVKARQTPRQQSAEREQPTGRPGAVRACAAAAVDAAGVVPLVLFGLALTGYLAWQVFRWGGPEHQAMIGDSAFVPVNLGAVLTALAAAKGPHTSRRARRGWMWLAGALACYLVGDIVQLGCELGQHPFPLGTWADLPYLLFYPLALTGLLQFPQPERHHRRRLRQGLDIAIVVLSGATVLWYLYLRQVVEHESGLSLDVASAVAYPVGDMVILLGVVSVLRRIDVTLRRSLKLLVVGFLIYLVADVVYGHLQLNGQYSGGDRVDTGWFIALATIGLAGWIFTRPAPSSQSSGPDGVDDGLPQPSLSRLPYLALAGVYGPLLYSARAVAWNPIGGLVAAATGVSALVAVRQITAQYDVLHLLERNHSLAVTDDLTGLPNRRRVLELATVPFATAQQLPGGEPAVHALILIDIDQFRVINDKFGRQIGDLVLQTVAEAGRTRLRPDDVLGRYGADQFLALLPSTSADQAEPVVEGIRQRLRSMINDAGIGPVPATISVGIADGDGCRTLDDLIARAEDALAAAKDAGHDRFAVYGQSAGRPAGPAATGAAGATTDR